MFSCSSPRPSHWITFKPTEEGQTWITNIFSRKQQHFFFRGRSSLCGSRGRGCGDRIMLEKASIKKTGSKVWCHSFLPQSWRLLIPHKRLSRFCKWQMPGSLWTSFFYTKNKTQKGQLFPVWSSWFQTSWPFIALAKHRRPTVPPGSFRKNQRFCALSFCWFHNLQWWKIPPQTTCHMGMFHLQELPWYGHWFMTGSLKKVTHYNPEKIPGCFQK